MKIRFANENDACALLGIYANYINTPITFETELPTEAEFAKRIRDIGSFYPYLVCEIDGIPAAYAYAHRYMERRAYDFDAELSIYIDPAHVSYGIGKMLYTTLIDLLVLQGVKNAYGIVTVPNEKSERLHLSLGFGRVGIEKNSGYKNGAWHDVCRFEKEIATHDGAPEPIVSIHCADQNTVNNILKQKPTGN